MIDRIAVFNERVRIIADLFKNIGLAVFVLSILRPWLDSDLAASWPAGAAGLAIWSVSLYIVGHMKAKED